MIYAHRQNEFLDGRCLSSFLVIFTLLASSSVSAGDIIGKAAAALVPNDASLFINIGTTTEAVAQALLREALRLGVPGVAAPSANRFGRVSATCAAHVMQEFGPELKVLDGGECPGGIESAIVDCTTAKPALLRPGLLQRAQLEAVLGMPLRERDAQSPRSSGSLNSHYAPAARVRLMSTQQLRDALDVLHLRLGGLPYREIAEKLGVGVAAVEVRHKRALEKVPALKALFPKKIGKQAARIRSAADKTKKPISDAA
jgi:hypothetical protein